MIVEFATRLYRRAASIVAVYTLLGGVLGTLVAASGVGWYAARSGLTQNLGPAILVIALVGAVLGAVAGSNRAFAADGAGGALPNADRAQLRAWIRRTPCRRRADAWGYEGCQGDQECHGHQLSDLKQPGAWVPESRLDPCRSLN